MSLTRREFLQMLAVSSAAGFNFSHGLPLARAAQPSDPYELPDFGNVTLMHFTDCHAQLLPIYFREPNFNIGIGDAVGHPPHLVGEAFLKHYGIAPSSPESYAFTYLNFEEAARKYGRLGGFAHLATLVNKIRAQRPSRSLLLDSGDTWQGSATSLWTQGLDMVDACKLLGVDVMTGHWEFTYGMDRVREIVENHLDGHIDFVAQNVRLTEDAQFAEKPAYDLDTGHVFKPYTMREVNGVKVGIVGQAFPYTTIANPRYLVEDWSFGIREEAAQEVVDSARGEGAEVVVLLSHNGMDVDLKMASQLNGVDVILGGHTHDGMPKPSVVSNSSGKTLVVNSGSNGKFLSVLDLQVAAGRVADYQFRMLPVFSNLLPADPAMSQYIDEVRAPFKDKLEQTLATTESTLYRRGNFTGTFDQVIVDALMAVQGSDIAFSPGFRWGTSVLAGEAITLERLMDQTGITYATATLNEMSGETIKVILEDIADNLFNPDPYYQMGGDMVRVGGLKYAIDPSQNIGSRISNLELNGKPLDATKTYTVAGWASVNPQPAGKQVWDIVSEYLIDKKVIKEVEANVPAVKGIEDNAGYAPV
ncbi:MAG: thiosulfohydrolase SoxB [Gammaproteobacteria bacterium]|nr:thiosulfohydrolase SoxB [Gammaproteobacteria bacterium]